MMVQGTVQGTVLGTVLGTVKSELLERAVSLRLRVGLVLLMAMPAILLQTPGIQYSRHKLTESKRTLERTLNSTVCCCTYCTSSLAKSCTIAKYVSHFILLTIQTGVLKFAHDAIVSLWFCSQCSSLCLCHYTPPRLPALCILQCNLSC